MLCGIAAGMIACFLAPTAAAESAPNPPLGDAIALLSGIGYAGLLLGLRWLARVEPNSGTAAIAWGNAITAPVCFALMPVAGQEPSLGSAQDWLVIAVLGVLQVGLAYAILVRAIVHVPAVRTSLLLMVEPALNPLIAWAVHGETPHVLAVLGGALIIGAVAAGSLLQRSAR